MSLKLTNSHSNGQWYTQYKRALRWLSRVEEQSQNPQVNRTDIYWDNVLAAFVNVHNLRDWLIKSDDHSISKEDIDSFAHNDEILKICRDISNGSKHLRPQKTSLSDDFGFAWVYSDDFEPVIEFNGDRLRPKELLDMALEKWKLFLTKQDLLQTEN